MYEIFNSFFLRRMPEDVYLEELDEEEIGVKIAPENRFRCAFIDNIIMGCLSSGLRKFASDLDYLLPLRAVPSRQMLIQPDKSFKLGNSGENVYKILYQAYFSNDKSLKEKVNISGKDTFFQMFFVEMHRQNRFIYGDSKINKREKNRLVQLGFHEPEDHIFVGVALNTGKTVITDDSDYGANGEIDKQEVYEYMLNELKLNILNSKQARERYFLLNAQ